MRFARSPKISLEVNIFFFLWQWTKLFVGAVDAVVAVAAVAFNLIKQ